MPRFLKVLPGLLVWAGAMGCSPAPVQGPTCASRPASAPAEWTSLLEPAAMKRWKVVQGSASFDGGVIALHSGNGVETTILADGLSFRDGVLEVDIQRPVDMPDNAPLTVALRLALRIDWSSVYIVCRPQRVDACRGSAFCRRPEVAEHFEDIPKVATGYERWRFELTDGQMECFRDGVRVLKYTDKDPRAGTIALTAAGCKTIITALRYKAR